MYKKKLDELLKRGVLTKDEYDEFFKTMKEDKNGQMIGGVPSGKVSYKYYLDGDISNLLDFVIKEVSPPLGAECIDDTFKTYGYTYCGICDGWDWFRKDTITDKAKELGHKPIEEATELELWKMMAISSRYWETNYKEWYRNK